MMKMCISFVILEMEYSSFLWSHINAVVTLTDNEFELVLSFFEERTIAKKEYLVKAGQIVTSEFLVVKGLVKAFMNDVSGREHILQFAMENWWISDYPAYAVQGRGEICVQALENCIVLELSGANKLQLCEKVNKMYNFHGRKAFGGYVALQRRVLTMLRSSAKEKYDLLLEQYPELFQRVSKTMIAHYWGVSRETLSRLERVKNI